MTDVSEAEGWAKGLDEVMARLAPRFVRVEPRRRALVYLRGLLAGDNEIVLGGARLKELAYVWPD